MQAVSNPTSIDACFDCTAQACACLVLQHTFYAHVAGLQKKLRVHLLMPSGLEHRSRIQIGGPQSHWLHVLPES